MGSDLIPRGNSHIVTHLFCDSTGRVWIMTSDEGVFFYTGGAFFRFVGLKSFKNSDITAVNESKNGEMWFGIAPHYVAQLKENGEETIYDVGFGEQKGSAVNSILFDNEDNVWFALDNGVSALSDGQVFGFDQKNALSDDKTTKLIQDREGNIWLATDRGGVQRFSHAIFKPFKTPNTINAICEDKTRDCIWLGADDGLYCYKNGIFVDCEESRHVGKIRVRHVGMTKDGGLLVSTYEQLGQLLFCADGTVKQWTKDDGLSGMRVRVALQTKKGDFLIGTTTGLSIFSADGSKTTIDKDDGIPNDYIMALFEASDGTVWVGTDGGGIFAVRDGYVIRSITTAEGLAGNIVFKIDEVRPDEIWINTGTGLSIMREDGRTIVNYDASSGLGTDSTFQALSNKNGKIFFTSNRGIFSVPESDFDRLPTHGSINSKWYGRSDGIITSGVTSTSLSMCDSKGNLWFTLIDGFLLMNAGEKGVTKRPPVVHIEEITVGERKVQVRNSPVIVNPDENRISIKFSGLNYASPEQVRYKTKLRGFDADYSQWTATRTVSYTNLAPKTYHFTVIAMDGNETVSLPSNPLVIEVRPAFYQRTWFWIFLILVIAWLLFFFVRGRVRRIQRAQLKLETLVNERTEKLENLKKDLERQVEQRTAELKREKEKASLISIEVTTALSGTIDAKDKYTRGHSQRVAEYSRMLARALGKDEEYQNKIYYVALLHDIGKIGIPDTIINKPGKLTDEEFAMIKAHPVIGSDILKSITMMPEVSVGARWHHERYDGKGYPDHLAGEKIPELARIICVADSYDAMTSNRSYRKYLSQEFVRTEFVKGRGTQFDPVFADKMVELIDADKDYKMHE